MQIPESKDDQKTPKKKEKRSLAFQSKEHGKADKKLDPKIKRLEKRKPGLGFLKRVFKFLARPGCFLYGCFMQVVFFSAFVLIGGLLVYSFFIKEKVEKKLPKATVLSMEGKVMIKKKNHFNWDHLEKDMEIGEGDLIQTGDKGKATLVFYDSSCAHIGTNSEVLISKLYIDSNNQSDQKIGLKISVGKVWSRIFQLMDKNASYEVESSNTVATVRGTAFDFVVSQDHSVEITSIESEIEVASFKQKDSRNEREIIQRGYLLENMEIKIDQKNLDEIGKQKLEARKIKESKLQSERFLENLNRDQEFKDYLIEKKQNQVKKKAGILPDSRLYEIEEKQEDFNLKNEVDKDKFSSYVNQRLSEIYLLGEKEKLDQAFGAMEKLKIYINNNFHYFNEEDKRYIERSVQNQLAVFSLLMADILPGSRLYELKVEFEELQLNYFSSGSNVDFIKLKILEKRIKEEEKLKNQGSPEFCREVRDFLAEINDIYEKETSRGQTDLLKRIEYSKVKLETAQNNHCQSKKETEPTDKEFKVQDSDEGPKDQKESLDSQEKAEIFAQQKARLDEYQKEMKRLLAEVKKPQNKKPKVKEVKAQVQEEVLDFRQKIRSNPVESVVISAGLGGFLAVLLLKRRIKKNDPKN
ncbi:MAG: hypothetical protein GF347_05460 [Candidatus Moranbacteria bacterium]|nr:hypothetical protein [Candidatus Moranbacteria bacterium]